MKKSLMQRWKNLRFWKKCSIVAFVLLIFLISYVLIFILIRPFDNQITQDRPIMRKLCEMQEECKVGKGPYPCSYRDQLRDESISRLKKWDRFNGCNNMTEGFIKEGEHGYVYVESCVCGGLM